MSAARASASFGNSHRYQRFRANESLRMPTITTFTFVSSIRNACLKYSSCHLPMISVISEISLRLAAQHTRLYACLQMPEGPVEEESAVIRIFITFLLRPESIRSGPHVTVLDRSRGWLFPHIVS